MFCTNCGSKFDDSNSFCPNCGSKVERLAQPVEAAPVVAAAIESETVTAAPIQTEPVTASPIQTDPVSAVPVESDTIKAEPVQWGAPPAPVPAPAPAPEPVSIPVMPVYSQPLYGEPVPVIPTEASSSFGKNDPELAKSTMVIGILAAAFSVTYIFSFMGIIFGAIGLTKAKKFADECGQLFGKAKIGKFLSLGGLIAGSVITAYIALYLIAAILTAVSERI